MTVISLRWQFLWRHLVAVVVEAFHTDLQSGCRMARFTLIAVQCTGGFQINWEWSEGDNVHCTVMHLSEAPYTENHAAWLERNKGLQNYHLLTPHESQRPIIVQAFRILGPFIIILYAEQTRAPYLWQIRSQDMPPRTRAHTCVKGNSHLTHQINLVVNAEWPNSLKMNCYLNIVHSAVEH